MANPKIDSHMEHKKILEKWYQLFSKRKKKNTFHRLNNRAQNKSNISMILINSQLETEKNRNGTAKKLYQ